MNNVVQLTLIRLIIKYIISLRNVVNLQRTFVFDFEMAKTLSEFLDTSFCNKVLRNAIDCSSPGIPGVRIRASYS